MKADTVRIRNSSVALAKSNAALRTRMYTLWEEGQRLRKRENRRDKACKITVFLC